MTQEAWYTLIELAALKGLILGRIFVGNVVKLDISILYKLEEFACCRVHQEPKLTPEVPRQQNASGEPVWTKI
jgi:hypothetical protein